MKEFIIPEEGFVVKTTSGRPILSLSVHPAGNVLTMFGADGEPKLVLGTEGDGGSLIIGDVGNPEVSGAFISAQEGPFGHRASVSHDAQRQVKKGAVFGSRYVSATIGNRRNLTTWSTR